MTTTEILNSHPSDFPHRIEAAEATDDCKCGGEHDEGDALWGGKVHPDEVAEAGGRDQFDVVRDLHDVEVEYGSDN